MLVQSVCELIDQFFGEQRKPYEERRAALLQASSQLKKDGSDWHELTLTLRALEF